MTRKRSALKTFLPLPRDCTTDEVAAVRGLVRKYARDPDDRTVILDALGLSEDNGQPSQSHTSSRAPLAHHASPQEGGT